MKKGKITKLPPPAPQQRELENAADILERWAKVLRQGNDAAKGLGSLQLTWKRDEPGVVNMQFHAARGPDGYRVDLREALRVYQQDPSPLNHEDVAELRGLIEQLVPLARGGLVHPRRCLDGMSLLGCVCGFDEREKPLLAAMQLLRRLP